MKITEDFDHYVRAVGNIASIDTIDLWSAVQNVNKQGSFECFQSDVNGHYFVVCTYHLQTLRLADNSIRKSFLAKIEKQLALFASR